MKHSLKDYIEGIVISKDGIAILHGDGFRDDTKAIQLIIDGGQLIS